MSFDHVAVDQSRMAGDHALRHAIVEFEAHKRSPEHVLACRRESAFLEVLHPGQTTAAAVCLPDINLDRIGDRLRCGKQGQRDCKGGSQSFHGLKPFGCCLHKFAGEPLGQ